MIDELEVLKIVTGRLESAGIPYMVSGSVAANFYAAPRMTRDIDIVIEISEKDTEKIFSLFSGDFYIDKEAIKNSLKSQGMFNVIHYEAIVKVDFIIRKNQEYSRIEFGRKRKIIFGGSSINIVSPEDLIISKLFWAKDSFSEIQIKDVKNLIKTVDELDMNYIKSWVKKLGLEDIFKEADK
ncbi:MAG: nucleotidyltransferase [Deltaproteobacteria bacterium]|nr:nucleotidyltransferase [Deltaproteobacteria bacterium]